MKAARKGLIDVRTEYAEKQRPKENNKIKEDPSLKKLAANAKDGGARPLLCRGCCSPGSPPHVSRPLRRTKLHLPLDEDEVATHQGHCLPPVSRSSPLPLLDQVEGTLVTC